MDEVPKPFSILTSRAHPLEMKGRVYASCVRSSMIYGSEYRPLQMIRWMCDVYMKDKKTSEELRKLVGIEPITTVIRSEKLRWYDMSRGKNDED